MQLAEATEEIVAAGRWLDARGLAPATSGNYSVRLDERRVAITVSGRPKGRLAPEDVVVLDESGRPSDARRPSAEAALHLALYRRAREVGAVLHVHSVTSTVLSLLLRGEDRLVLQDYELLKAFPGIDGHEAELVVPILENLQDRDELARAAIERLRGELGHGFLIRGHGMYAWGASMEAALRAVEAFEFLFTCEIELRRVRA